VIFHDKLPAGIYSQVDFRVFHTSNMVHHISFTRVQFLFFFVCLSSFWTVIVIIIAEQFLTCHYSHYNFYKGTQSSWMR